jgi:hypothetical protein
MNNPQDKSNGLLAQCSTIALPAVCGRCSQNLAIVILVLEGLEEQEQFKDFCQMVAQDAPDSAVAIGQDTGVVLALCASCTTLLVGSAIKPVTEH